ncbi:hypothetical protein E2C01_039624 [Portunus trituberculatus]|uniref:Uncharacterized protein n=1 Tax=Portunus trituberculatus TaxID=210409 RepID=A0A5B7FLS6_PORTR|nr:hypothetical protein [Portunus trituberculatus]
MNNDAQRGLNARADAGCGSASTAKISEKEGAIVTSTCLLYTTPSSGAIPKAVEKTFSGFKDKNRIVGETMMRKRIY